MTKANVTKLESVIKWMAMAVLMAVVSGCIDTKSVNEGSADKRVTFSREFAPSEGLVKGPEAETRREICLNGKWDFQPVYEPYNQKRTAPYGIAEDDGGKALAPDLPDPTEAGWDATKIKVPSSWNSLQEFPSYPEKWARAEMGWLRKRFVVPADWDGRRTVIAFQAVSGDSKIFLNGEEIGTNFDSVLPFAFDITDKVRKGAENELLVGIRGRGFFNWQGSYGQITVPPGAPGLGIWQDVFLLSLPEVRVTDVLVKPEVAGDRLSAEVTIQNDTATDVPVKVGAEVREWLDLTGGDMLSKPEVKWKLGRQAMELPVNDVVIPAHQNRTINLQAPVGGRLRFWDFSSPNLYGMTVSLSQDGRVLDKKYQRFGWREFKISGKDLLLNGRKIQLLGDSQHLQNPTYLTRRFAWSWFTELKDLGANAARLHAMVWPEYLHDMADEMGIALLPESSIYASSCDLNYDSRLFWKASAYDVDGMVRKYRNHPSVFGWSIENEALPALNVKCNDQAYKDKVYAEFDHLADICRRLDTTRDWISGDGSKDEGGKLPIYSEHYGSTQTYLNESAGTGKPYGVGEASIAYYATPRQAEAYVGDRAYRSYRDFSDAVAIDAYELLKVQRKVCVYCSVWNAGYYGVEELPVGMKDTSRSPQKSDGVFLTAPYVEGKPGIQPERIAPYRVQFNPGYDPHLPLYRPLPLFQAIKAAYHQPEPAPCEWDHRQQFAGPSPVIVSNPVDNVRFYGDEDGDLFNKLKSAGIPVQAAGADSRVMVIDCNTLVADPALAAKIREAVGHGSMVIFWGLSLENQGRFASLLPYPLEVFNRAATSLVHDESDNRVASISYKDLYFTENPDAKFIMKYALGGDFVKKGRILLQACPVDWASGNNGGMMRSERENPPGPCLVEVKEGMGSLVASTLSLEVMSAAHIRMISQLFEKFGVLVKPVQIKRGNLFDQTSVLSRTLGAGFWAEPADDGLNTDFLQGEASIQPEYGATSNGAQWNVLEARQGWFDFGAQDPPGTPGTPPGKHRVEYLSFWVYSPQPLDEIMADPNVPEVGFKYSASGGSKIWLNGRERFTLPGPGTNVLVEKLPLTKGWNHFLVKLANPDGAGRFSGRLVSRNATLLAAMKSAFNPHSSKANFYTVDHTDPEIKYDQYWALQGDGWHESFTPGARARFWFYGTGIALKGRVGPDGGKADLYIDGKLEQAIDYQREQNNRRVELFSKSGLRDGEHEVVIEAREGRVTVGPYDQWESYPSPD